MKLSRERIVEIIASEGETGVAWDEWLSMAKEIAGARADGEKKQRRIEELEGALHNIIGAVPDYTNPEVYVLAAISIASMALGPEKGEQHEQE